MCRLLARGVSICFCITLFSNRGSSYFNNSLNWSRRQLDTVGMEAFQTFPVMSPLQHTWTVACSLISMHQNLNELRRVKTTGVWKMKEIKSSKLSCSVDQARRFSICEIKFFSDDGIVRLVVIRRIP